MPIPESLPKQNQTAFETEVADRFGLVPNFFRSAAAAPALVQELWGFAKSAYLDNPLPSLFKERLFVHLSRFCKTRYCIVRHVGFLTGQGNPAGDSAAPPETVEQVAELLARPAIIPAQQLAEVLSRIEARGLLNELPASGTEAEYDLFAAASIMFLEPMNADLARKALRTALGPTKFEILTAYLAFIRTAHYWTETHPEITFEEDMEALMHRHEELASLLMSTSDAQRNEIGQRLYAELKSLRAENEVRKHSQEDSEEQFRLLVQSVTDYAIYMLDPTGKVTNWNVGAERIKGYAPDEIIGSSYARFFSEEDRAAGIPQNNLEVAAREGRFEQEGWRYRKDGSRFWAHVVIDAIADKSGKLMGFAKVTRDITERKEAQTVLERAREAMAQSQKMEAVGQLTGGIAHDFNNLLMAVLGSLELIRKRLPEDGRLKMLLNNAFEGARRGVSLTQRMLSFARRQELTLQPIKLGSLLNGMGDLMDRTIGPHYQVKVHVDPSLPPVRADQNQLETALLNLAINARDAMPHGGAIVIHADARCCDDHQGVDRILDKDCIVLSVTDHGHGMDEITLKRATEPFFTTKGVGKGTGLGLSMVHGMVEQLGGRMRITSQVGHGTAVELWLPLAESLEYDIPRPNQQVAPIRTTKTKLTILVVDDDNLVLTNTAAMLEDSEHTALQARSGAQALEVLQKTPGINLVITDQAMPNMTGVQLAAAIRIERPELPILLVSGYAELPMNDKMSLPKLAKPFSLDDLDRAVANVMTSSSAAGETYSSYRE